MSEHETAWEWFQSARSVPPVAKLEADHQEIERLRAENKRLAAVVADIEKLDCSRVKTLRDDPSLIHCPINKPCQKHRLERLQAGLEELRATLERVRPYLRHHHECDHLMPTLNPAVKRYPCDCGLWELQAILEADDSKY